MPIAFIYTYKSRQVSTHVYEGKLSPHTNNERSSSFSKSSHSPDPQPERSEAKKRSYWVVCSNAVILPSSTTGRSSPGRFLRHLPSPFFYFLLPGISAEKLVNFFLPLFPSHPILPIPFIPLYPYSSPLD
ncbi:uncharacterized protein BP01DRAFT_354806 [Aspergillus saccharolyticus JOP 1030-1]|uniref:Uncharacterized protein n=1 Tax=Aspergillus saccharolyticus JOP 1030-1 TaxID=1450539 RepID=A0A318ZUD1_9EURO|nr:hypothetical protein BP01DRAFT_354806 [Aspergillus saccharolyticus JOP 1030-1]PYH47600.1 hypothetical protein BP01DRAFT_354806 [Aspergillus saccharolyticus JOP 1030-1]